MTVAPRHLVLGGALAATLAATAWVATRPQEEAAAVLPVRHAVPAMAAAASAASAPGATLRQAWAEVDVEQLAAWQPPPPAPLPAPSVNAQVPPPSPIAPPFPYQMTGRLVEGEGAAAIEVAMLNGPNSALNVRRGDVIDSQWRVDAVSSSGLRLTWMPAKLSQNVAFSSVP